MHAQRPELERNSPEFDFIRGIVPVGEAGEENRIVRVVMKPFHTLRIPLALRSAILAHAQGELPRECCGLLAGRIDESGAALAEIQHLLRNDLESPSEYFTNAMDLLKAMKAMRVAGHEPLAIYHSHPTSEPVPSRADLQRNTWGESVVHLIVGAGEIRGWWLGVSRFDEARLE